MTIKYFSIREKGSFDSKQHCFWEEDLRHKFYYYQSNHQSLIVFCEIKETDRQTRKQWKLYSTNKIRMRIKQQEWWKQVWLTEAVGPNDWSRGSCVIRKMNRIGKVQNKGFMTWSALIYTQNLVVDRYSRLEQSAAQSTIQTAVALQDSRICTTVSLETARSHAWKQ